MPAISGTLAQSLDFFVSGTLHNLMGIVANAAENVAWVADSSAAGRVHRVTGIGTTLAKTDIVTGMTVPVGVALSADESTLYIFQQNGNVYSVNATSGGTPVLVGTMSATATTWNHVKDGKDGWVYMLANAKNAIYRFSLTTFTGEIYMPLGMCNANGLSMKSGDLYTFVARDASQTTNSVLSKVVSGQGRMQILAGTGGTGNTDGEAFLVSTFDETGDVEVDSTGDVYGGSGSFAGSRIRMLTGGTVSSFNVGSSFGGGTSQRGRMWMLRTANKLLMNNGSSTFGVIT